MPPTEGPFQDVYGNRVESLRPSREVVMPGLPGSLSVGESEPLAQAFEGLIDTQRAASREVENVLRDSEIAAQRTSTYFASAREAAEESARILSDTTKRQREASEILARNLERASRDTQDAMRSVSETRQEEDDRRRRPVTPGDLPPGLAEGGVAGAGTPDAAPGAMPSPGTPPGQEAPRPGERPDLSETDDPWRVSPASLGQVRTTDEILAEEEGVSGALARDPGEDEARERLAQRAFGGRGGRPSYDLRSLQGDARESFARRLSQYQGRGPQLFQDEQGAWQRMEGGMADEGEVETFLRSQRRSGIIRNVGGGMLEGRSTGQALIGALPMGAARLVGGAGIAAGLATAGVRAAESQRAQNVEFQQHLGGSNVEGFQERMGQQMFRMGQMGVMGRQDSQALYQGALQEFGGDREMRGRVQEFGAEMYRELGMSVQETMALVREAASSGNDALLGLTGALESVSEASQEAGVSAQQARESFIRNYGQMSSTVGGVNAALMAQRRTESDLAMGRDMQDVRTDTSSMEQQVLQAQALGMDLSEYQAVRMDPVEGMMAEAEAEQITQQQVAEQLLSQMRPGAFEAFQQQVQQEATPEGELPHTNNAEAWRRMGQVLVREGGIPLQVIIEAFRTRAGVTLNESDAAPYLAQVATGQIDPVGVAEEVMGKAEPMDLGDASEEDFAGYRRPDLDEAGDRSVWEVLGDPQLENVLGGREEAQGEVAELQRMVGLDADVDVRQQERELWPGFKQLGEWEWSRNLLGARSDEEVEAENIRRQFVEDAVEGGEASPVMARFLREVEGGTQIEVQTAEGPRVVSLEDAVEHFADQIIAGTAVIAEGRGEGQTAVEVAGIADPQVEQESSWDTDLDLSEIGQDLDEFRRDREDRDEARGSGAPARVVVEPGRKLEEWFEFHEQSGGARSASQRQGVPASPASQVPPTQMPGG